MYFSFLYIFRPNDSRMLVALGESYEKLAQQVEAKKVQGSSERLWLNTYDVCVCVRVFWAALCLCSVIGGPTQWGTWRKWLCSNWQSEWQKAVSKSQSSRHIQLDLDCVSIFDYKVVAFFIFIIIDVVKGYMNNWTSLTMPPSPTCSTSRTSTHVA